MQSIGISAGGRPGEKVEDINLNGLEEAIGAALAALHAIDVSDVRHQIEELAAAKAENEKVWALLDHLVSVSSTVLAEARKDGGFVEGEATDRLFHKLEKALGSVDAVKEWLDKGTPRTWR